MGKLFDIRLVFEYAPIILSKFHMTLLIVLISVAAGTLLGLIIAALRIHKVPIFQQAAIIYVSFMRGTPIIIQLFIVYYGLPLFLNLLDININRWDALYFVLVTYSLNNAAFMSEIIRSAIVSVPAGQTEAAYSIGLNRWQTLMRIVLPQAVFIAFPSFGTRLINALESTSLAFTLGIINMMGQVEAIGSRTYHVLEGYTVVAAVFVVISLLMEKGFSLAEKRFILGRR